MNWMVEPESTEAKDQEGRGVPDDPDEATEKAACRASFTPADALCCVCEADGRCSAITRLWPQSPGTVCLPLLTPSPSTFLDLACSAISPGPPTTACQIKMIFF